MAIRPLRDNEYVEISDVDEFRSEYKVLYMAMWNMLNSIPGEWEFAGYAHFFSVSGIKCYNIRYHDKNHNERRFDIDWDQNIPFNKAQIRIQ